jgi:hypothetical protein
MEIFSRSFQRFLKIEDGLNFDDILEEENSDVVDWISIPLLLCSQSLIAANENEAKKIQFLSFIGKKLLASGVYWS